jgi:hypothetical protein
MTWLDHFRQWRKCRYLEKHPPEPEKQAPVSDLNEIINDHQWYKPVRKKARHKKQL